jgi:hypothetical protein
MKRQWIWMCGASALLLTLGIFSRPVALLAQAVKSTLVRSVDEPGREPYMETMPYSPGTPAAGCSSPTFVGGGPLGPFVNNCQIFFSTVPAGKRLIIKDISSRISIVSQGPTGFSAEGNLGVSATIGSTGPQPGILFLEPHTALNVYNNLTNYNSILVSHTSVQAYVDAGIGPIFTINVLNGFGSGNSYVTLTGYYVDIP